MTPTEDAHARIERACRKDPRIAQAHVTALVDACAEIARLREAARMARVYLAGVSPSTSWDSDDEGVQRILAVVRKLDAALAESKEGGS